MALKEIVYDITKRSTKLSKEDEGVLLTIQMGGGLGRQDLAALDADLEDTCSYCDSTNGSLDHTIWDCPFFQGVREDTDKDLAKVRAKMMLPCIRRGIAPMMCCSPKETYWGWKIQDAAPTVAKLLGAEGDYQAEGIDAADAEEVLNRITKEGLLNARQAMEAAKGAFGEGITPDFPPDVKHEQSMEGVGTRDGERAPTEEQSSWAQLLFGDAEGPNEDKRKNLTMPRETIDTYTDGGVKHPTNKWLATAGFGIWTPAARSNELDNAEAENYTNQISENGGVKQWARLPGQRCSSTMIETAATVVALIRNKHVHIGTDSAAMMTKATKLQTAAISWVDSVLNNWRPKKNPFGRPWGLQTDGDLWQTLWEATLIRGPSAHCLTKVKGHATTEDVAEGVATLKDKNGNDEADDCATKGVESMGLTNATKWLSKRYNGYKDFIDRVDIMDY